MGLRPAKTVRVLQGQPWARISNRKPRKSFVKGAPRPKVRQYNMGTDQFYDTQVDLVASSDIQLRDNAFEAARQVAVKYLEKHLLGQYFFGILKYPHLIAREHSALGVAGADRISKGMKRAFGRPKGRFARIYAGDSVFRIRVAGGPAALHEVKEAYRRAKLKMSGSYHEVATDIRQNALNMSKIGKVIVMKVKVTEEKPKAEATPAAGEEKKEGEAAAGEAKAADAKGGKEEKKEAGKEGKKEEKK